MKKHSLKSKARAAHRAVSAVGLVASDAQVREFESKDLGKDIKASGAAVVVRREKPVPTSILIEPDLMAALKQKAAKKGLGYQTFMKMIVRDHIAEY